MDYIVFDLEWNQCPYGKESENPRLPFEIIEIGAVKLDESKKITDTFHALIRPRVYKKMHYQTRKIVHLKMEDLMREGRPFYEAARDFFKWCGDAPRFCIWGTGDLTELQRNLKYYGLSRLLPGPILYEDVQKLFAINYETRKQRRALSYAVDFLKIPENGQFHEALDDAWYTACVLQTIPDECIEENYSVDYYAFPKSRAEEITLRYPTYEKFISRTFATKEALLDDPVVSRICCFECGRQVKKLFGFFPENGRNFVALGRCGEHGIVKSKIRVRKASDGKYLAIRTVKMPDAAEIERIKEARERYLEKAGDAPGNGKRASI